MNTIKNSGSYKLWKKSKGSFDPNNLNSETDYFPTRKAAKRACKKLYGSKGRATFLKKEKNVRS